MQKQRILKITGGIISAIILLLVFTFVILFWIGYRFTSKNAVNQIWHDNPVIHTKDYDFYYFTFDIIEDEDKVGEIIEGFIPVKKSGFLYKAIENWDHFSVSFKENEASAGVFTSFKGDNCYYNFFMRSKSMALSELSVGYTTLNVNGKETDIFNFSYFVTDEKVTEFEIEGKELTVKTINN